MSWFSRRPAGQATEMATPIDEPRELFLRRLRTLLWVENTLEEKVLPEVYDRVHATDLKWAVERHLTETRTHAKNLREVFRLLQEPGDPLPSPALLGLQDEHDRLMKQIDPGEKDVVDLLLVDVIAHTEHLEIAAYGGLVHTARALDAPYDAVLALLENMEQDEHALEQAEHALAKLLAEKVTSG